VSTPRCSEASLAAGETLAATATTVERWLLLEVAGTWPRDVGSEGALPETAASVARDWLAKTPRSRLLFLRRPGRRAGGAAAYVVQADADRREVRRLDLARLEDLAASDLDRDGEAVDTALVLVCGHGSRDACCALFGTPVYGAVADVQAADSWISSHQGGHRFAANVLILPAGIQLGRVEPERAAGLVRDVVAGRIELDRYRGRTFHEPVVQAAEIAVRRTTGLVGVDDLRVDGVDGARIRFVARDGRAFDAEVEQLSGPVVPASCGADPEEQTLLRARVLV
jgi:hypothetical protein